MSGASISICVIDADPIHGRAFEAVAADLDCVQLVRCESMEGAVLLDFPLDLVLVNMEHGRKCSNLILVKILDQFPAVPVLCYALGKRWVGKGLLKQYGNRVLAVTYGELVRGLGEYVESIRNGASVFPLQPPDDVADPENGLLETLGRLSPREREVLCLLGKGDDILEISGRLGCQPETVKSHCKGIRRKLKLCGMMELRHLAVRYAATRFCKVFFLCEDHICPCRKDSVGTCPLLARPSFTRRMQRLVEDN